MSAGASGGPAGGGSPSGQAGDEPRSDYKPVPPPPPLVLGGHGRRDRWTRAVVRALPPLLLAAGFVFGLTAPPTYFAAPFFTAAPLIAAPFAGLVVTIGTGVAGLVLATVLHVVQHNLSTAAFVMELITVAVVCLLAALINLVIRRGGRQLASVQHVAEAAQRAVLPVPPGRIGGFDIAAQYEAAEADAFIGGDLYAVQDSPHGVRMVLGDVRGKGLGAVEAVSVVIGAFREAAEQESTIEGVAARLERALAREGMRRRALDAFEGFTTAVLVEIPHGGGVLRVVNRGHTEPLLLHHDGKVLVLSPGEHALPLGMGELGTWPDRAEETEYPPGAMLLLYTDGLSEARDTRGRFYDPVERLRGRVFEHPTALLSALAQEVRDHTGGATTDDMALLAVRRPHSGAGAVAPESLQEGFADAEQHMGREGGPGAAAGGSHRG